MRAVAHMVSALGRAAEQWLTGPSAVAAGLLALSVLVSAAVVFLRSDHPRTLRGLIEFALPSAIVTHPSARADVLFWVTRKAVMLSLALPAGITVAASVGYAVNAGLPAAFGHAPAPRTEPGFWLLVAFTASMLLVYDLSCYLYRVMQHRFPILWELHKVHHSAEVMVGTTKDRVHPLDEIMNKVWDGLLTGPVYGLWLFFVFNPVELTVLGLNVYVLRNILMMDFVRHTHLKISFGRVLNQVVLCPHYHQLHHSVDPVHYDRNFGLMLTVWDRLFGTLPAPAPDESFEFGLMNREAEQYRSLRGLYLLPVWRMGRRLPGLRGRARVRLRAQAEAGRAAG